MNDAPNWIHMILVSGGILTSAVVWAYSTFVPRAERDILRAANSERLERIENKQDQMMNKIDHLGDLIKRGE